MSEAIPLGPATVLPEAAGVYLLKHLTTGDTYIGSSANLYRRCRSHWSDMRSGKSAAQIARLVQAHGVNFEISILEITTPANREQKEAKWIKARKPTLNIGVIKPTRRPPRGMETCAGVNFHIPITLRERVKAYCAAHTLNPSPSTIMRLALEEWLAAHESEVINK